MTKYAHWLSILVVVLLLTVSSLLLPNLKVNNAPEVYFPSNAEAVRLEERIRTEFPRDQVLIAVFVGTDLLAAANVRWLRRIADELEGRPDVERVLSVASLDQIRAETLEGSDLQCELSGFEVRPLLEPEYLDSETPVQRLRRAQKDEFAPGSLISEDGSTLALVVRPQELEDSLARHALDSAVREAIAAGPLSPHFIGLTGSVPVDVAELNSMIRDTVLFVPLTTVIGLILIWVIYRRVLAVVVASVAITVVVLPTMSLLVLIDRPMTMVASLIPPFVTAMTIALLMHLFSAFREHGGGAAVKSAVDSVRRPALFSCLTTAGGILSLTVSPIVAINSFGWCAAFGALLVFPVVIYLVPPIFTVWDRGEWGGATFFSRFIDGCVSRLFEFSIRRPVLIVSAFCIALVAMIPMILQVEAETDVYEFFQSKHPITRVTKQVESKLSGVMTLQVIFESDLRDAFLDSENLGYVRDFERWADLRTEVDKTMSAVGLVEEMNWAFNCEEPQARILPPEPNLIAQYVLIYDGKDLQDYLNRERSKTVVALSLNVRGANDVGLVISEIQERLEAVPPPNAIRAKVGGFGRLFADQEDLLISGQVRGLWVALAVIGVMMLILWQSASETILTMIPNVSPIVLIFATMGAFGIWLDMATALIASVAIGVAVDDTVHIFYGIKRRVESGVALQTAMRETYRVTGRAVVVTTLILCAEFTVLLGSNFVPTTQFGGLTALGLSTALLFDLCLLPAILVLIGYSGRSELK